MLRRERRIGWRAMGLGTVIASFINKDTGEAWPSRAKLAAITGIEESDISRVAHELEAAGFLVIEDREGRSNIYRLTHWDFATGGKQPPSGIQPPTHWDLAFKPIGIQPPIIMKKQSNNNEGGAKPKKETSPKVIWDGQRFLVPDTLLESWRDAYPCVNLDIAIKRAASWYLSNPAKKKKNYAKFLNNWFGNVKAHNPEYVDPEVKAASDAELIRGAEQTFDNPDERADYWWRCKQRGEYVPPGVDCRPMPAEKEVAV